MTPLPAVADGDERERTDMAMRIAQIELMEPGPDMDRAVAKSLGWRKGNPRADRWANERGNLQGFIESWSPSTQWADAHDVLSLWQGDVEARRQNGQWRVTLFRPSYEFEQWAETFPLAVCRARLLAAETA